MSAPPNFSRQTKIVILWTLPHPCFASQNLSLVKYRWQFPKQWKVFRDVQKPFEFTEFWKYLFIQLNIRKTRRKLHFPRASCRWKFPSIISHRRLHLIAFNNLIFSETQPSSPLISPLRSNIYRSSSTVFFHSNSRTITSDHQLISKFEKVFSRISFPQRWAHSACSHPIKQCGAHVYRKWNKVETSIECLKLCLCLRELRRTYSCMPHVECFEKWWEIMGNLFHIRSPHSCWYSQNK